ncbi:MAG: FG-GAP repeat protein [Bdellovibrionales bacterium]|nr:FG-GAP repeat protein [Bdellovibrionales bacterium]
MSAIFARCSCRIIVFACVGAGLFTVARPGDASADSVEVRELLSRGQTGNDHHGRVAEPYRAHIQSPEDGYLTAATFSGNGKGSVSYFTRNPQQSGDAIFVGEVRGQNTGDAFGAAIATRSPRLGLAIPDLNGNGYYEVVVGAPGYDGSGGQNSGRIYVIDGSEFTTAAGSAPNALCSYDGATTNGLLGSSIELLGAQQGSAPSFDIAAGAPGLGGSRIEILHIQATTGGCAITTTLQRAGRNASDSFGASLAVGYLVGGGTKVLVVGAPTFTPAGSLFPEGYIRAFTLNASNTTALFLADRDPTLQGMFGDNNHYGDSLGIVETPGGGPDRLIVGFSYRINPTGSGSSVPNGGGLEVLEYASGSFQPWNLCSGSGCVPYTIYGSAPYGFRGWAVAGIGSASSGYAPVVLDSAIGESAGRLGAGIVRGHNEDGYQDLQYPPLGGGLGVSDFGYDISTGMQLLGISQPAWLVGAPSSQNISKKGVVKTMIYQNYNSVPFLISVGVACTVVNQTTQTVLAKGVLGSAPPKEGCDLRVTVTGAEPTNSSQSTSITFLIGSPLFDPNPNDNEPGYIEHLSCHYYTSITGIGGGNADGNGNAIYTIPKEYIPAAGNEVMIQALATTTINQPLATYHVTTQGIHTAPAANPSGSCP